MKLLCETNGDFQLIDFGNGGDLVAAERPSVVRSSAFISSRAALGQLSILGQVSDEATDDEFEKYVKDSDNIPLAVESFLAAFNVEVPKKVTIKKR